MPFPSVLKIRNLGQFGIIHDVDPYDLPPSSFSDGVNVRFRNGRVTRGPVFRSGRHLTGSSNPRFAFANNFTSGLDDLFIGYQNGRVFLTNTSSETDVSVSGFTENVSEVTWSTTALADILYVNREDRAPWYIRVTDSVFQPLGNMDSSWTCKLLRSCGGALVALNVTKVATSYPTMVKTSSFALSGSIPTSWDITAPNTNATENILAEMEGPIVDACSFGNNLVIYSRDQAWLMQKVSSFENFDYYKLPFSKGAMSANCSVEIDGKNFIFGVDDIWVHDGTTETSLVDGTNRDYIFSSVNMSKSSHCFVAYNPSLKEVHFCYPSGDGLTAFNVQNGGGCNRQAVYNLVTKTWTFDDLPYVWGGAAHANLDTTAAWNTVSSSLTWTNAGGSWQDQDGSLTRLLCYVGETNATYGLTQSLYAFDIYGAPGTASNLPVDTNATKGLFLERNGIDLHTLDPDMNLASYTQVNSVWPMARMNYLLEPPISFTFGSNDYFGQDPVYDQGTMTYNGNTDYKLDYNAGGRYLALRISFPDYQYISISGMDLYVQVTGQR